MFAPGEPALRAYRGDDGEINWYYSHEFNWTFIFKGTCWCCEYRQYILEPYITEVRLVVDDFELAVPVPPQRPRWPEFPATDEFVEMREDCGWIKEDGRDVWFCYGHRRGRPNIPVDQYTPDRLTGCRYFMRDYPGANVTEFRRIAIRTYGIDPDDVDRYTLNITRTIRFLFVIKDTCRGHVIFSEIWEMYLPPREFALKEPD